jgi:hypothetical protein
MLNHPEIPKENAERGVAPVFRSDLPSILRWAKHQNSAYFSA